MDILFYVQITNLGLRIEKKSVLLADVATLYWVYKNLCRDFMVREKQGYFWKKIGFKVSSCIHIRSYFMDTKLLPKSSPELYHCTKCDYYSVKLSNFNKHCQTKKHNGLPVDTKLLPESSQNKYEYKFNCEKCYYYTDDFSNFKKHNNSIKHRELLLDYGVGESSQKKYYCIKCNKKYKYKQGLYKHDKICIGKICNNDETTTEMVQYIHKETVNIEELTKMIMELHLQLKDKEIQNHKQLCELHQQLLEQKDKHHKEIMKILPNIGNNNNNKYNIQILLNEECKDALNLSEFVKSLPITIDDLIYTKNKGLIPSTQNVIVNGLKSIERTRRPIHCTDEKRKIMYIKEDGIWDKDNENKKLKETIQTIAFRQAKNISLWEKKYPTYMDKQDSYENYKKLIVATCKDVNVDDNKVMEPILKSIGKEAKWEDNK